MPENRRFARPNARPPVTLDGREPVANPLFCQPTGFVTECRVASNSTPASNPAVYGQELARRFTDILFILGVVSPADFEVTNLKNDFISPEDSCFGPIDRASKPDSSLLLLRTTNESQLQGLQTMRVHDLTCLNLQPRDV